MNLATWLMRSNFAALRLRYYGLDFPTADSCISAWCVISSANKSYDLKALSFIVRMVIT